MGIAEFTKQLAQQAVGDTVQDAIDSIRPGTDAVAAPDSLAAIITAQVQAMQNALKEDKELLVLCTAVTQTLRVLEIFSPSPRVLVLTGIDSDRVVTRVICPAETLQLVCKPVPVREGEKPVRVRFIQAKTK